VLPRRIVVTLFAVISLIFAPSTNSQSPPPAAAAKFYSALTGCWTGILEYRDYQSNERVKLPTWLEITATSDPHALQFHYTYDDGPNKTVEDTDRVELNLDRRTFTETSPDKKSQQIYQVDGLEKLSPAGLGTLTLTGTGLDDDKKVDVRITLKLGRNYYRYAKETRLPGADFQFRDAYDFTRRDPPPVPH